MNGNHVCTFFTSIPEVPSKTCPECVSLCSKSCPCRLFGWQVPERQLGHLFTVSQGHSSNICRVLEQTSSLKDLARSLRPIGKRQRHNLGVSREFDLEAIASAPRRRHQMAREAFSCTFSRMTSGPLTPPTVLYRIRGTTEYDDESRGSPMMKRARKRWQPEGRTRSTGGREQGRRRGAKGAGKGPAAGLTERREERRGGEERKGRMMMEESPRELGGASTPPTKTVHGGLHLPAAPPTRPCDV